MVRVDTSSFHASDPENEKKSVHKPTLVEKPVESRSTEHEIEARDAEAEGCVIGRDVPGRSALDRPPVDEDPFDRLRSAVGEPLRRDEMRPVDAAVAQFERASLLGNPGAARLADRPRANELA